MCVDFIRPPPYGESRVVPLWGPPTFVLLGIWVPKCVPIHRTYSLSYIYQLERHSVHNCPSYTSSLECRCVSYLLIQWSGQGTCWDLQLSSLSFWWSIKWWESSGVTLSSIIWVTGFILITLVRVSPVYVCQPPLWPMTHCIITLPSPNPEILGISPFCSRIRIPLQILRQKSTTYVTFSPLEAELQIFLLTRVSYEVFTSMIDFHASSCLISMHAIGEQLGALLVPFVCNSVLQNWKTSVHFCYI